jgi:hypothetical protein
MLASSSKTSYRELLALEANVANLYPSPFRRARLEKSRSRADFIPRASLPLVGRNHCGPTIFRGVRQTTQNLWCVPRWVLYLQFVGSWLEDQPAVPVFRRARGASCQAAPGLDGAYDCAQSFVPSLCDPPRILTGRNRFRRRLHSDRGRLTGKGEVATAPVHSIAI